MNIPLTRIEGTPDPATAIPGMAHFAGTGPIGKTCGDCIHRGYYRNKDDVKKHYGCQQFRNLSQGRNGPAIHAECRACKYFQQKPKKRGND